MVVEGLQARTCTVPTPLPQLAETPPGALLVADGFSCKTQIEALSGHRPMHVVEAIAEGVRARTQMVR
jgi:hypothetical protein